MASTFGSHSHAVICVLIFIFQVAELCFQFYGECVLWNSIVY